MFGQSAFIALLTVSTLTQGVKFPIFPFSTAIADSFPHCTSIGYYYHTEGLSRPSYASSKCSGRLKLEHSFRRSKCLESQLDDLQSDSRQTRFSIGLAQLPEEHDLKCETRSPPPLDVIPLIVSGSSTNRVNLVFFSDGCMFVIHIQPVMFIFDFWRQMLQMNATNSSKMQDV